MTGDVNFFRNRFIGGFNKEDVTGYIKRLANERNEMEAAKKKAESIGKALAAEVASLRREIENVKREMQENSERKAAVFDAAENTFAEYNAAFEELRIELETGASSVVSEMKNVSDAAARLKYMLSQADGKFEELRSAFDECAVMDDVPTADDDSSTIQQE